MHERAESWMSYADKAGVPENTAAAIHRVMRRELVTPT